LRVIRCADRALLLAVVNGISHAQLAALLILVGGLSAGPSASADALSAVQYLREGGCGGILPGVEPLRRNAQLDRAAERWAAGAAPAAAAQRSGYAVEASQALHLSGSESSIAQRLRRDRCRSISQRSLRDVGAYERGSESWLILASAYAAPAAAQAPVLASRALQLVNEARARGARCGGRSFGPAPPIRLSSTLADVALGHAADMAKHDYFEHEDLAGRSPAQRVRAVGYRETLVGENIAYGPKSAEEVVQGWLDSPGHCENIMDPRFAEMGIAYAAGQASRHGLYWVQLLAAPGA
jgi:uncharacterized protein YkwD